MKAIKYVDYKGRFFELPKTVYLTDEEDENMKKWSDVESLLYVLMKYITGDTVTV